MYYKPILIKSSYKKRNHIIKKFNNCAVKQSYGIMIFDVKRYKY